MAYTKYKDAYLDAFRKGLVGESYKDTLPDVSSNNPYAKQMNEELEIGTFAHDLGITLRDNMFGAPSNPDDEVPIGNNHHHDDRYAKLIHNHDERYYTKDEEDAWRDRLINGDLLFNKINAKHIQAGTIVAGSSIIADGAIGSAQISRLDAGKIESGTIDTSKLTIMGANGNLLIRGNRLQVFEGIGLQQFERVSLGDVNNDGTIYGLRVRGKDGNTILYDENGVYREGITDGSITNDKIGDDADIDGGKLNIGSVIRKINEDGSETIDGVKIQVDNENLLAKLSTITLNQDEHSESIKQNTASIEANSKSIKLKVDEQKYTEDMSAMTSELEKQTASIEVLKEGIELKANKTEVTNQIKEVKDFVSSEVGDISVGSANYVNNSAPRKATVDEFITWDRTLNGNHRLTYWEDYNDTVELPQVGYHAHIDLKTFHFPCIALINRNATYSMANRFLGIKQEIHKSDEYIRPNEYVTISFDAYADTFNFNFHGGLYHRNVESEVYGYHSGNMEIRVPQENVGLWRRYSYTFKTHVGIDLSQPMYLHILGHNNPEASGYIKNIKLEHGKLVSQWTPSAFDVDDSLDDAVDSMKDYTNESIKTYDSEVKVKFDNINLSVSETVKELNGVKGSVAEIDIKSDAISQKVESLDGSYSSLVQDVDSVKINFKNSGSPNKVRNYTFKSKNNHWGEWGTCTRQYLSRSDGTYYVCLDITGGNQGVYQNVTLEIGKQYTLSCICEHDEGVVSGMMINHGNSWITTYAQGTQGVKKRISSTFIAESENATIYIGRGGGEGVYGVSRIESIQLEEGSVATTPRPNPNELYEGIITLDGEGISVQHSDGAKSKFTADAVEFTQTNGNRALRIKDGGMNFHTWVTPELVGFIKPSIMGQNHINGVSISTYNQGDYISIGYSESASESGWTSHSAMLIVPSSDSNIMSDGRGTYLTNLPIYAKTSMYQHNMEKFKYGAPLHFATKPDVYNNRIYATNDWGTELRVVANETLNLGVIVDDSTESQYYALRIVRDTAHSNKTSIHSYAHWDFHHWNMYNMKTVSTLSAQSTYLRSRVKDINDVYGSHTTDPNEVRCKGKGEFTCIGETVVEIPQIIAENIQDDYQVHISKYGFGDYYIKERNPYYFIIEADREFSFDWEVVATMIEKPSAYSIIASDQYNTTKGGEEPPEAEEFSFIEKNEVIDIDELKESNELYKLYTK